jgi:glutaredoxin
MSLKVEIYGRDDCRFCAAARAFCQKRALAFVYHDMTSDVLVRDDLYARLGFNEPTTVPQIFLGLHRIGGFEDLQRAYPAIQQIIGG